MQDVEVFIKTFEQGYILTMQILDPQHSLFYGLKDTPSPFSLAKNLVGSTHIKYITGSCMNNVRY